MKPLRNEEEIVKGGAEGGRSQQGYLIGLAPPDILNATDTSFHPIAWASTVIKRVCRASLHAETMALTKAVESGTRLRAAIVDMKGKLNLKNWEQSASSQMGHVWLTDCDSLYEHLVSPKFNTIDNKRLGIDLMALRQLVWERNGERTEFVDSGSGDYPRWIDTSTMLADPLTKAMDTSLLDDCMNTGKISFKPTEEAMIKKAMNKEWRKKAKEQAQAEKAEREVAMLGG